MEAHEHLFAKRDSLFDEEANLQRLLISLDSTDQLELPVCIDHRDQLSPDFVLSTRDTQIGVELTRSTDEELMRGLYLFRTEYKIPFIDKTWLCDSRTHRSNDELKTTMGDLDAPWQDEQDFTHHQVEKIVQAIARKCEKFHNSDFQRFDHNWLLVYDENRRFASADSLSLFHHQLFDALRTSSQLSAAFDRVYIFCVDFSFRWREGKFSIARASV